MKRTGLMAVALAAAVTVACGGGAREEANQENPGTTVGTGGEIGENREAGAGANAAGNLGDVQEFVRDVSSSNAAEIELGRIAQQRGQSNSVKEFGRMMVEEHTKAGAELKTAIAAHNIPMPEQMDQEHQELAQRLRGLSGMEFDREYMDAMVEAHEETANRLEDRAEEGRENQNANQQNAGAAAEMAVNQWAAKTLPNVQKHRERAEQIREQLNNNNRQTQNDTNSGSRNTNDANRAPAN